MEPIDSYDSVLYILPESSVASLLEQGYGVNQADAGGEYLLTAACQRLLLQGVLLLLAAGADPDCREPGGDTPLLCAIDIAHHNPPVAYEIVQALLAAGADIEARGYMDKTPFLKACTRGCLDILKLLVANGCDIQAKARDVGADYSGLDCAYTFDTGHEFKEYLRGLYRA